LSACPHGYRAARRKKMNTRDHKATPSWGDVVKVPILTFLQPALDLNSRFFDLIQGGVRNGT
jgi:hypothetical protein